ncbi:MAG: glycosyltransferase [Ruminococcus sp.]|nr:glycosyltransferase [Ruminococcus sp.]
MKLAILVVTYNRKELLMENISAIASQSYGDFDFYICDNASTDGTADAVKLRAEKDSRIKYYNTGSNLGGAGGFAFGLNIVLQEDYDYCWIMDDDSIPEPDSLEKLMKTAEIIGKDNFSFLANYVVWTDGQPCKMNICMPLREQNEFEKENGIVPINRCSFVGCFINADAARKVGLPFKEFFIYGDDVEYTLRLNSYKKSYMVEKSVIVHKMPSNVRIGIAEAPAERIERYGYEYRNRIYYTRRYFKDSWARIIYKYIKECAKVILRSKDNRIKRLKMIIGGFKNGIKFNPEILFPEQKW